MQVYQVFVFHVNESQAIIIPGECENPGQTRHKCELVCNSNGACTETVSTESCGCDGYGFLAEKYTTFRASIYKTFFDASIICNSNVLEFSLKELLVPELNIIEWRI